MEMCENAPLLDAMARTFAVDDITSTSSSCINSEGCLKEIYHYLKCQLLKYGLLSSVKLKVFSSVNKR